MKLTNWHFYLLSDLAIAQQKSKAIALILSDRFIFVLMKLNICITLKLF
ncbi:MAG: hypothetical protein V7L29_28435 [Nostoc sp.]